MPAATQPATRSAKRPPIGDIITDSEVVSLYVDYGLSLGDIAARLHCTESRIAQIIKRSTGMTPAQNRTAAGWVSPRIPPWTSRRITQVYRAHPHWTARLIAREADVPVGTVTHVLEVAVLANAEPGDRKRRVLHARLPVADTELVRLYVEERHTTVELGARFGVDPKTVGRHLQHLNVTLRPQGGGAPPLPNGVTVEDVRRLYIDEHLSIRSIGTRFNISPRQVSTALKEGGHTPRSRKPQPLDADLVVTLYVDQRWSTRTIADSQGVAARRVQQVLTDRKVTLREPYERGHTPGPTPIPGVSIDELRHLYFDEHLPLTAIAARFNTNKNKVSTLLRHAGYTLRPRPLLTPKNPINTADAVHAYVNLGWSINKISETQHVARRRVRQALTDAGITLPS